MDWQTFDTLIKKYTEGTALPAEIRLLEAYYEELQRSGHTELSAEEERMLTDLSYRSISGRIAGAPGKKSFGYPRFTWLAAALAAGILLVSAASYLFISKEKHETGAGNRRIAKEPGIDVMPASEGAILTLADGSTILLDNITNGQIAEQGASRVIKNNGRIVYDSPTIPGGAEVSYNTIFTPYGRQCNLVLPDGTSVFLNAGSSLRFPTAFTGKERKVEMSGEAYFAVAHDPSRPFVVNAEGTDVQALGTEFNINAYRDETDIRTTLVKGSVKVKKGNAEAVLMPGQQSIVDFRGEIELVRESDMEKILAWKNNTFLFENDELKGIMRQLARWYDVEVEYKGDIPPHRFSGIISRERKLSAVLSLLETADDISFRLDKKKITVNP